MTHEYNNLCVKCGSHVLHARWKLGYNTCLQCGDKQAKQVKHTIVPMPKSNYIVVTDLALLVGLNSSHKGGTR
jgi:ribosomal protein L37AE/L43A